MWVAVGRYMVICRPLHARYLVSVTATRLAIVAAFVVAVLVELPTLWTSSVVPLVFGPCGPPPWSGWSSVPLDLRRGPAVPLSLWTSTVVPLGPPGPPPWSGWSSVPLDLRCGPAGLRSLWTSTVVPLVCPSADGEATARYFVSIAITAS